MKDTRSDPSRVLIQRLLICNRLTVKAFSAETIQALIFIILNDTIHLAQYNRAALWDLEGKQPVILGISGQAKVKQHAEIVEKWATLVEHLKDPNKSTVLSEADFSEGQEIWRDLQQKTASTVLWIPIFVQDKPVLGLWLENWEEAAASTAEETMNVVTQFLAPGYGSAWQKFQKPLSLKRLKHIDPRFVFALILASFISLFLVHIPLRIVAPCEVVPKDPFLVTAPLDGIIEKVTVQPGQIVAHGDVVAEYDKRVPLQTLKAAEKSVQMVQSEADRAMTLGLKDNRSLTELGVLNLKLEKEKVNRDILQYQASQLTIHAPEDGIVIMEDPDQWRGKPVKVGEKILVVSDPSQTKIRIWLPENDNISLAPSRNVDIFLNADPENTYPAILVYVANDSTISPQKVPSFIADAEWKEGKMPPDVKLGLKGSAIVYGEDVSIFYFIFRKPWAYFRSYTGL